MSVFRPRASPTFQSTLPVWGATFLFAAETVTQSISIHAPRVGSDLCRKGRRGPRNYFNPRSPCGERRMPGLTLQRLSLFQSTLPVWGATWSVRTTDGSHYISIHAPRVGSDAARRSPGAVLAVFQSTLPVWGATCRSVSCFRTQNYFNPRSPCGERPGPFPPGLRCRQFQSTLPVWGATASSFSRPK